MKKLIFMVVMIACVPVSLLADTHTAADCEEASVQTAITAATAGDIVAIPEGSCTWTTAVTVSGKALTIQGTGATTASQGAGTFGTHITSGVLPTLSVTASDTNFVTVKDIEFIGSVTGTGPIIGLSGTDGTVGYRFTNIKFTTIKSSRGVYIYNNVYGLFDHVTLNKTSGGVQGFTIIGDNHAGYVPWNTAHSRGTDKAVYIEDSLFDYNGPTDGAYDGYNGSRIVFRYNRLNNVGTGTHGTDSGGHRSVMDQLVYNNDYYNTTGSNVEIGRIRGGALLFYNNTVRSGTWYGFKLANYRSCSGYTGAPGWKLCNGTNYKITPTGDATYWEYGQVDTSFSMYFCSTSKDIACETADDCPGGESCNTYFDGADSGYPCRDQAGRSQNQASWPVYTWGNTANGGSWSAGAFNIQPLQGASPCARIDITGATGDIQLNRDYYKASSYDDAVSKGLSYTEYTYPHPLTGPDTTPTLFTFTDNTDVEVNTVITSNSITVAGIDAGQTPAISITGTGCTYSIDGAAYTSDAGTVGLDNVVTMRQTSPNAYSTASSGCTLTIGGVADSGAPWTVTTKAATVEEGTAIPSKFSGSGMTGSWK